MEHNMFAGSLLLDWKFWSLLLPVIGGIIASTIKAAATLSKTARDVKDELSAKINTEVSSVKTEISLLNKDNKVAHEILHKSIEKNTEITKEYSNLRNATSKLNEIKAEACHWAPKELSQFLIMKADSMKAYFTNVLERKFSEVSMAQLRSEMQVKVSKLKVEGESVIDKEFIQYYLENEYSQNMIQYLQDLARYKSGKMNNVNEAFLNRSIVFYRHSLETLLDSFTRWKESQLKKGQIGN